MKIKKTKYALWDIIEWILLHLTLIFSGIFLTLWILNVFNWQMEFLTSRLSNRLMLVYFSTALLASGLFVVRRAKNGVLKKNTSENPRKKEIVNQSLLQKPSHRPRPVRSVSALSEDRLKEKKEETL